jgi:WD40 repeat protein
VSLVRVLKGYSGAVVAVCAVDAGDRTLLATLGSRDGTVRLRNPADGSSVRFAEGYVGAVDAVCAVDAGSRTLLATGSRDGTVRLWDPADGTQVHVLEGYASEVTSVCAVDAGDRTLLATSSGRTVRLWDPADGSCVLSVPVHGNVPAMTSVAGSLAIGLTTGVLVIRIDAEIPA